MAQSLARRLTVTGTEKIDVAMRAVNAELFAHVGKNPDLAGMGSTAVGMVAHENRLAIFNVGDSRAYKVGERCLMQLSTDDTMVQNWKAGSGKDRTTMLLQCFGGRETFTDIQPHVHTEPCMPGSTYMLCCDGLYETLSEEEMAKLIGQDLQKSAEALLRAALEKKARDNVTIALIRISE